MGGRGWRGEAEKRLVGYLRANRSRRQPAASPEPPGFLKLWARGNDAARRRAACNGSHRTSQRPGAWDVRIVSVVSVLAGIAGLLRLLSVVAAIARLRLRLLRLLRLLTLLRLRWVRWG
jgi:hypothetical protein